METLTEQCGKCGGYFATLNEVFSHPCEPNSRYVRVPNGFGGSTTVKREAAPQVKPATPKMIKYLRDLAARKMPHVPAEHTEKVIAQGYDRVKVALDRLVTMPEPTAPVRAGHYAVETEDGRLAFYRVDRPEEGRWKGYTFVHVQASDDYHRLPRPAQAAILRKIAQDPQAAMLRYGQEIGRCGHCNRTLTNEESRRYGIGPVCRENMGW